MFEGEYLNGKRNGKGKAYDRFGNFNFEGEFLYNFRLKGKSYLNGKLEYESDYLYKKMEWKRIGWKGNIIYELIKGNGKVKEYDSLDGLLIFEGEYLKWKRNGKGKEYYKNGIIKYEGVYLNGNKTE